jgi:hypothetical protein
VGDVQDAEWIDGGGASEGVVVAWGLVLFFSQAIPGTLL